MLTHASPWHEVVYIAGRLELVDVDEIVGEELPEDIELEYTVLDVTVKLPEPPEIEEETVLVLPDDEGHPKPIQMLIHARPWQEVVYVVDRLEVTKLDEVLPEEEALLDVNVTTPEDPELGEVVLDVTVTVWLEVRPELDVVCGIVEVLDWQSVPKQRLTHSGPTHDGISELEELEVGVTDEPVEVLAKVEKVVLKVPVTVPLELDVCVTDEVLGWHSVPKQRLIQSGPTHEGVGEVVALEKEEIDDPVDELPGLSEIEEPVLVVDVVVTLGLELVIDEVLDWQVVPKQRLTQSGPTHDGVGEVVELVDELPLDKEFPVTLLLPVTLLWLVEPVGVTVT
ncbi:MAG: hypothetical protein Q9167_005704 [Letrouitia subvulpina]